MHRPILKRFLRHRSAVADSHKSASSLVGKREVIPVGRFEVCPSV